MHDNFDELRDPPARAARSAQVGRGGLSGPIQGPHSGAHQVPDLRCYFGWCAERALDPLSAARPHAQVYVRWMQEQRRLAPGTVSRRLTVVVGFYRTCVIDGVLDHSPADYVRQPTVSPQSPTLGLTHLQFEAMLTAARDSTNPNDFALVCLLGLLGLRIFETTSLDICDLGEEHGHRVVSVVGKGHKVVLVPMPPAVGRAVDRRPRRARRRPDPAEQRGRRMDRPRRNPTPAPAPTSRRGHHRPDAPAHAAPHLRHHHARRRRRSARHPDRRPPR